jgi:ethanolamine ammonia-lyase small subunit
MRAPATPCTRRSTTRACAPSLRRLGCPCSRSRARRRTASTTSCVPTSVAAHAGSGYDVAFIVADGLSARAVAAHAQPLLAQVLPRLADWRIAPLVVARLGRVALGDAVANALHAEIAVMLIGERPGLSAPDSMGAYLTFAPTPQTSDAERNCISNIRPEGLPYPDAAIKLVHLIRAMRARRLSGVQLKDDAHRLLIEER